MRVILTLEARFQGPKPAIFVEFSIFFEKTGRVLCSAPLSWAKLSKAAKGPSVSSLSGPSEPNPIQQEAGFLAARNRGRNWFGKI
jgi:hypothetical protein